MVEKICLRLSPINRLTVSSALLMFLLLPNISMGQSGWFEKDSEHFRVIYKIQQSFLADQIISAAESSFNKLDAIFHYVPSEKIVINTYDFSDYGFAGTTTTPRNFIRLEIEPLELAYENIPYKRRINWLISHELVHVVVNDQASKVESTARKLFSKVAPEQQQPLTIFYSLLTNYNRYTPVWYQEGIAVFLETWLNGGFGRVLGNFDETYFRSLVAENIKFSSIEELDARNNLTSFLQGTLFYLYGERFCTYLAINYGSEKLITWYKEKPDEFYESNSDRFKEIFNINLNEAWSNFIQSEKLFQEENISRIKKGKVTDLIKLTHKPLGWVTEAHFDSSDNAIIFGYHTPDQLAGICKLNLKNKSSEKIGTLPTPSLVRVASTAFNENNKYFFYTTKNNELYRDLWVLNTKTGNTKLLFPNSRIGDITVSAQNNDLWGVIHSNGKTGIVFSEYPYNQLKLLVGFNFGDDISDLAVSPTGHLLAGVLHREDGSQSVFITNCDTLKSGGGFRYLTISGKGSPEFPSWSRDEKYLYWNAYTNGVSNIYRKNLSVENSEAEPVSNAIDGLFKPVYLNKDSVFAFEFTANGFVPVIIPNKEAEFLHAIKYLGDKVVENAPEVVAWNLIPKNFVQSDSIPELKYNSLKSLRITSFIPVVTGFQDQKVLGFFAHISDPLLINDITMEFGYSPFKGNPGLPKFHFKGKYEFKNILSLSYDYNPTDFYDLFNNRKRGMIGSRYGFEYTNYWVYDNPLKVLQKWGVDYYSGINFLTDNIIKVSQPDFFVVQTSINSKDLRRSIGSVGYEEGNEFNLKLLAFGSSNIKTDIASQLYGEWDNFSTWMFPHNTFHLKLSGGYAFNTGNLVQAKFYFGGFGNRYLENQDVDQFRKVFSFPGIPIYSQVADNFGKIMLENEFPPVRFSDAYLGNQYLSHFDISLYSQTLLSGTGKINIWGNMGAQINFVFYHWYNLESTLSAGIANAWYKQGKSWEWFVSLKLLRN